MRGVLIAVACVAISACATPYGEQNVFGGVTARRIDENTVLVSGRANAFTSQDTMQTYLLRKAADETIAAGYDLFLITSAQDRTRHDTIRTPSYANSETTGQATFVGNQAFGSATTRTTYAPGQNIALTKPGGALMIKLYRGAKPANAPPGLYDAHEIQRFLTPPTK